MNNAADNDGRNLDSGDDIVIESFLAEAVGGPQPPDLSNRIMQALHGVATTDQVLVPSINHSKVSPQVANDAATLIAPNEVRKKQRPWPLLIGLASLAASVAIALLYFPDPPQLAGEKQTLANADPAVALDTKSNLSNASEDVRPAEKESEIQSAGDSQDPSKTSPAIAKPIQLDGPNFGKPSAGIFADESADAILPAFAEPGERMADAEIVTLIDARLTEAWATEGVEATAEVDASEIAKRVADVLGVDVGSSQQDLVTALQSGLKRPEARDRLASRLAASMLGRTGVRRINKAQFVAFVEFIKPTLDEKRFDSLAGEMLMARGAVEPDKEGFNPAAVWMGALAGPQSVALTEQAGHTFLDVDLRCGRCHDHPLDGRVWQDQYWQFSAMFDTGLRWLVGKDGILRVQSPDATATENVVFYERTDGRQRAASPKVPQVWLTGTSASDGNSSNPFSGAAELERLAASMHNNPQLAKATVNRVWESVYGRPLVGSAADPSAAPESGSLVELQSELAEQFRAHQFNTAKLFTWILAAKPMRLELPPAWRSPMYESATGEQLAAAAEQVRAFASFPTATPKRRFDELLARVDIRDRGLIESLDAANNFPGGLLGQFQASSEALNYNNGKQRPVSSNSDQLLSASLEAMEFVGNSSASGVSEALPAEWLARVDGPDPFQRRAEHLYYLAGYWHPSPQQLEVARALRDGAANDATALRRLWWVLANESL